MSDVCPICIFWICFSAGSIHVGWVKSYGVQNWQKNKNTENKIYEFAVERYAKLSHEQTHKTRYKNLHSKLSLCDDTKSRYWMTPASVLTAEINIKHTQSEMSQCNNTISQNCSWSTPVSVFLGQVCNLSCSQGLIRINYIYAVPVFTAEVT